MVATPGQGTPPSDKGAYPGMAIRTTSDSHRLRSALSAGHWRNTVIEMTLKVKITAAQLAAFARFLLLLLVATT